MRYHLCKKSRLYDGHPYIGPSSDNVRAETDSVEHAREWADNMTKFNPVGFDIYDSTTGEKVE